MATFRLMLVAVLVLCSTPGWSLQPVEVAVVANRFVEGSVDLARFYMEKRGIPEGNLVLVDTTDHEQCSRRDYQKEIARPVRRFLVEGNRKDIRCLVTMFGVPLRVEALVMSSAEKGQAAAVDSELSLVLNESYPLEGWLPNPFFLGNQERELPIGKDRVLFVSRLDGPSVAVVKRMIDDSLAAEKEGLQGTAYFDARWPRPDGKDLKGYAYYDRSLHLAAEKLRSKRGLPVVIDDKEELFQAGEAPGAAFYCGWYSLGRYVDAFDWRPGAVGYHIASVECATLRGSDGGWCKGILEDGVAATIGPVAEPYVQAFPVPELFFTFLTDGFFSLAEAYFLSTPFLSWQMVLVGDPLYRPYGNGEMTFKP